MRLKVIFLFVILLLGIVLYGQEENKKTEGGTSLTQYGILGTIVLALAGWIVRQEVRHAQERKELREERKEWQNIIQKQFDSQEELLKETNRERVIHTNILAGLKTLLEQEYKPSRRQR